MFSMGASVVFACDVGSVSAQFGLLTDISYGYVVARRQLSSEFRRYGLWLVAADQQMEPFLDCETCSCNH